jgi:hypothetical protein
VNIIVYCFKFSTKGTPRENPFIIMIAARLLGLCCSLLPVWMEKCKHPSHSRFYHSGKKYMGIFRAGDTVMRQTNRAWRELKLKKDKDKI